MDIKIKREEKKNIIPEVGQFWKYVDDDKVYYRVDDGAKDIFGFTGDEDMFYSITDDGKFVYTRRYLDNKHKILLKQDGPLVLSPV